ncbi:MAG: porin, partial [Rhodospirillaceae bacterium]
MRVLFCSTCLAFCASLAPPAMNSAQAQDDKMTVRGGPTFESADGNFEFSLGGRIHLDAAAYDEDGVAMDNGFLFRRARLAVDVTVYKDWEFKTQYDFAENSVGFADVFIRYAGFDGIAITAGQFRMPFGLEEMTSSNNITFMERSLPGVFATGRRIGLGLDVRQPSFTVATAVYGRDV